MGFLPGFLDLVAETVTLGRYFSESKPEGAGSALIITFLSALAADLAECVSETGDKFSDLAESPTEPSPLLGQHTADVYKELLGYTDAQLAEMKQEGLI